MENKLDSNLVLHVTCHYMRRPPIFFLVKQYDVLTTPQKFRSKFPRALQFVGFSSFFFTKSILAVFQAKIEKNIEKQLDSDLLLHVTCHYMRRPPIFFLVKQYDVMITPQKFRPKFLGPLQILVFSSFFFREKSIGS